MLRAHLHQLVKWFYGQVPKEILRLRAPTITFLTFLHQSTHDGCDGCQFQRVGIHL
jgi:hypothetical protein